MFLNTALVPGRGILAILILVPSNRWDLHVYCLEPLVNFREACGVKGAFSPVTKLEERVWVLGTEGYSADATKILQLPEGRLSWQLQSVNILLKRTAQIWTPHCFVSPVLTLLGSSCSYQNP